MSNYNVIIGNKLGIGADGVTQIPNQTVAVFVNGGVAGGNFYNIIGGGDENLKNQYFTAEGKIELEIGSGVYDIVMDGITYKYRMLDHY